MIKDPIAKLDFGFNWRPEGEEWLATGETITDYTITADTGLTVDSSTEDAGVVTVWLSGGTVGEWYDIACKITTSAGRTDERTLSIQIQER